MRPVVLIPLDARPVCLAFPKLLGLACGIDVWTPPEHALGHLKQPGDLELLTHWLTQTTQTLLHQFPHEPLTVIVALDTLAYGGLIASRVNTDSLASLKNRVEQLLTMIPLHWNIMGFSSILRIAAYNNAQEEPDYWEHWGKALSNYATASPEQRVASARNIPTDVLEDFLTRRHKNFSLNQWLAQHPRLTSIVFCQDDTAECGLAVEEAQWFKAAGHVVKTGADELACYLLAQAALNSTLSSLQASPSVFVQYSVPESAPTLARFDGIPINVVIAQALNTLSLSRASTPQQADFIWLVHTPQDGFQGDFMENQPAPTPAKTLALISTLLHQAKQQNKPMMLADLASANGGDVGLYTQLLDSFDTLHFLYGYAAWNTPGNSAGCSLAMGVLRWVAEHNQCFHASLWNQAMAIRLLDDALYQGHIRQQLKTLYETPTPMAETHLQRDLDLAFQVLAPKLALDTFSCEAHFPCGRFFEIAITLEE